MGRGNLQELDASKLPEAKRAEGCSMVELRVCGDVGSAPTSLRPTRRGLLSFADEKSDGDCSFSLAGLRGRWLGGLRSDRLGLARVPRRVCV
jgi:hypothetical protein